MQSRFSRIALILFFIGLLAFPLIYKRLAVRNKAAETTSANPTETRVTALARYGFSLTESSKASGIEFKHSAPQLDAKLSHIMEQVASMGAAVSVADFDRDGWQDVYVTNSGEDSLNALYRNLGNGQFKDVAAEVGLDGMNSRENGVSMGAVWGDCDNDGYEDLFVYKWGRPELFHNDGGKGFTRASEQAGLPRWVNANTAIWFDYDRDGKLDLFIGGYYSENVDLWNLKDTKMMPESFEYASNGGRKYLYHNLGGGKFEEVAEKLGIKSTRWALAAVAANLRGTGFPDLFIANDYAVSELFFNDGGKKFREVGKQAGVGYAPKSGMTAAVGDVLNRGQFGIYVTNISEEGVLVQGNNLWMPKAGTSGDGFKYENLANAMGVELGGWSFGAQFGDLNNDGHLDLYLTNGYISAAKEGDYWYDYSKIAGGNSAIISDAAQWPPMKGRSLSGYQEKKVWMNDGAGKFNDV
ncbi:MAG: VCBS repeat-containing protein, partial [Acidobacteriota bacterium]|nr:VCBS repeat-containing protein [Acidobacteriota bacterium]